MHHQCATEAQRVRGASALVRGIVLSLYPLLTYRAWSDAVGCQARTWRGPDLRHHGVPSD